ncbi:MAG: helix-turn-helix transcriptional regulator [Clostridia bacterium]|nr:helix-turn-helix transcriptional regulator [Clostridia bacterium]
MAVHQKIAEALERLAFENRETNFQHHTYEEDLRQYEYIRQGNKKAISVGKKMFEGPATGSISDDPLRNYQYLFVASITLACRFCIEGGMSTETAFNLSDLYIRQMDKCKTVQEIFDLHDAMFRDYTQRMRAIGRQNVYSQQVRRCMDYIDSHLQQPMTVKSLAGEVGLSPSYVSVLFMKETGVAVSEYVRRKRIETAKTLLEYTDFSCLDIAEYLCFSSDSHFSQLFHKYTGQTPTEYRKTHDQKHWESGSGKA